MPLTVCATALEADVETWLLACPSAKVELSLSALDATASTERRENGEESLEHAVDELRVDFEVCLGRAPELVDQLWECPARFVPANPDRGS